MPHFEQHTQLLVGLSPEGTRSPAPKWKSGFYQIAHRAQLRIVVAYIDYRTRNIGLGQTMLPSGDYAADLETLQRFYRTITPKHAKNFLANG